MNAPHSSHPPLLSVNDLHTYFFTANGVVKAVDGVTFEVGQGETVGIVGESGSGKSMLGLSLVRLVPQPAGKIVKGEVLWQGEDLLEKSDKEMRLLRGRHISMILQDPQTSLNPLFSIGNQLTEALSVHRTVSRKQLRTRAVDLLRMVGVAAPKERLRNYPHEMSGGMKQRVVGAMAVGSEPQLIIADEPTTSLDVTIQAQYLRMLKEIQQRTGAAIIFITHDFGIVATLCDRVLVMYAGRIVEQGPVRAIFNDPSHPYTEALLGSILSLERRVDRLEAIPGRPPALWDLPTGCRFAPRCRYAFDRCSSYPPTFRGLSDTSGDRHVAACWRLDERNG